MLDTSDYNERALAAEHSATAAVNDAGASKSADARTQPEQRLPGREIDSVATGFLEVDDVDMEGEEDTASTDVNDSNTRCAGLLESSAFALALVVIGMIIGADCLLQPSPTLPQSVSRGCPP